MFQAIFIGILIILGIGLLTRLLPYILVIAAVIFACWLLYSYWKVALICLGGLLLLGVLGEAMQRVQKARRNTPPKLSAEEIANIISAAVSDCIVQDANKDADCIFKDTQSIPRERAAIILSKFSKNILYTTCYYLSVTQGNNGTLITGDGIYICYQSSSQFKKIFIPFAGLQQVSSQSNRLTVNCTGAEGQKQTITFPQGYTTISLKNIADLCKAIIATPVPSLLYKQNCSSGATSSSNKQNRQKIENINATTRDIINAARKDSSGDPQTVQLLKAIHRVSDIFDEIRKYLISSKTASPSEASRLLEAAGRTNQEIARRLADKRMYVCIIGEFSCGKSTFINAMLEERFLIEDVLQGTTCSKTVIKYAPRENISVFFSNNTCQRMRNDDSGDTLLDAEVKRDFLRAMTAEEEKAREIREVIWESPIEVLENGLCIIDTPGIGSQNPRHTEVARLAGQESDALLVLTSLDKALSKDLLEEVTKIAGPEAANCIFIGTRKDQFPPREEARMRRHFRQRLSSRFGHECQFEFVSAYKALEGLGGNPEEQAALDEFRQFRARIKQALESGRKVIQSFKASAMINEMVEDITGEFSRKKEDFDKRIVEYQAMVISEDSDKWATWEKRILLEFDQQARKISVQAQEDADKVLSRLRSALFSRIDQCKEHSDLKECAETGLARVTNAYKDELEATPRQLVAQPMQRAVQHALKEYAATFQKEYEKLEAVLGNSLQIAGQQPAGQNLKVSVNLDNSGFAKVSADIESEEKLKIGGALATAACLSFAIPGVGWIAGAAITFVGGVLGAGLLKSVEKRKNELKEQVESNIETQKSQLREFLKNTSATCKEDFRKHLIACVEAQKNEYIQHIQRHNQRIEERKRALQEVKAFLDKKIEELQAVDAEIGELKNQISLPFVEKEETR